MDRAARLLAGAQNPVIYAGQGVHYARAWPELRALAETWNIPVTTSIGIATLAAESLESIDQLLNIADRRLYLAKNSGRNRICVSDDGRSQFA